MTQRYDVALSFAGSERSFVEQVAGLLEAAGIKVFYDRSEEVDLWGKDLAVQLDEVYRKNARFCVVFVSRSYAERIWPNHELKSALARFVAEQGDYILPVRFDDTELPGLRPSIAYVDGRSKTPEQMADLIVQKLGRSPHPDRPASSSYRMPQLPPITFNPYDECLQFIARLRSTIQDRCRSLASQGITCSAFESQGRTCLRVVRGGKAVYSLDVGMGGLFGGASIGFHGQPGEILHAGASSFNAWASVEAGPVGPILRLQDFSLLRHFGGESRLTPDELVEAIWERICQEAERRG